MRQPQVMYYGQRDYRGRPEVFRDFCDGTGPSRLRFRDLQDKGWLLPDWGKKSDLGRRQMLSLALLTDCLEDSEWAVQLGAEFADSVIRKLPRGKWQLSCRDIFVCITILETGGEPELRHN